MTADYELKLYFEGSADEAAKILEVIRHYSNQGDKTAYFTHFRINGNPIDSFDEEILSEIAACGKIELTANGPYGKYGLLNEIDIFRDMAEVAPKASFHAEISGFQQYSVQNLKCELKDGLLSVTTFYESNEESGEAWIEYFTKKLPLKRFKKLFKISGEGFDKEAYRYLLESFEDYCQDDFCDMEYDDFVSELEEYDGETELEEDEYCEIMEDVLPSLDIDCPGVFEESYEGGETNEYVYDPIAKKYVRDTKPTVAFGKKENANDRFANLSIEEKRKALSALLGWDKENK